MTGQPSADDVAGNVVAALEGRSPRLAGIYRSALAALDVPAIPGCESARVSIICHCMRELMSALPPALADTFIPREVPSSGSLVAKLPKLISRHQDLDLGADLAMVPVPQQVARAFEALLTARTREDSRNQRNAVALITAGTDEEHPAIKQWQRTYDFFMGWTHFDRNHEQGRTLPTDAEIRRAMQVVEDVVTVRTTAFFANLQSIKDLLAEINTTEDGDE